MKCHLFRYRQGVIDDTTAVEFYGGTMPLNIVINPDGVVVLDQIGVAAKPMAACLDSLLAALKR